MDINQQNRFDRLTEVYKLLGQIGENVAKLDGLAVVHQVQVGKYVVDLALMQQRVLTASELIATELDSLSGIAEAELVQEAQQRDEQEAERRRITEQARQEVEL